MCHDCCSLCFLSVKSAQFGAAAKLRVSGTMIDQVSVGIRETIILRSRRVLWGGVGWGMLLLSGAMTSSLRRGSLLPLPVTRQQKVSVKVRLVRV